MSLIACSRYGLEEEEIISILGIRRIDWHFLYGSMYSYFFTQNGRIGLQSEDLSDVIIKRYLANDPENVKNIRRRIVDCISLSTLMNKKEAAYQYYKLEDYKSLYETLLDIETTKAFVDSEPILLSEFWMALKHSNDDSIRFDGYLVPLSKMTDTKSLPYISIGHFFLSFMQDIPTFLLYCQSYIERILKEEGELSSSLIPAFNSLGWYYYGKNDYQEAISYFNKSLSILKKLGKKSEPLYLGIEGWISGAKNFMSLSNDRWSFPNAIPVLKTIIYSVFHKRKLTLNDATYFSTLSLSAAENGMRKQAIRGLKKSYSIVSSIVGESHPKAAGVLSDLASVYSKEGNLKKALELYEQALAIYRQSQTDLISGARARNNIASVYQRMGDLDRAKDYYLEAVSAIEGNVEASSFAASVYCNLGSLYSMEGNNNDALEYIMKALSLWEGVYGKNSFETITPRYWLGYIFKNTGEYSKALLYFLQANNLQLQFNRPVAVRFSVLWSEIGACYVILDERIKAKDSYMQALSSLQDEVIKYSLNRIEAYKDEISIYTNLSSLNDDETISINYLKEASWRCKKVYGSNSREYALNCNSIGLAFIRRGRAISKKDDFDTAHYYLYKATTILTPLLGETHPDVLQVNVNLGIALEEKQNYSSAAYYYQQYIASIESGTDNDNEVVSDICARLADICIYHIDSTNNAIYYASRALGIRNRLLGLHEKTASSWNQLGLAYYKNNQYTFAIESFIFAYVSFNALFGEEDANTQVSSNNIQQVYKDKSSSPDIALKYYKEAYEELKNKYGDNDNSVQVAKSWMDWVNDVRLHY